MDNRRETIIFAPGPIHLFWTIGIFYFWELSRSYNIVIVVEDLYVGNTNFKRLMEISTNVELVIAPSKGTIRRHLFFRNHLKRIVEKYRPNFIFHHDFIFIQMCYLYHWGWNLNKKAVCVSYLTGLLERNWDTGTIYLSEHLISGITDKYKLSYAAAKFLISLKFKLSYALHFKLIPFILIGKTFNPYINPVTFSKNINSKMKHFDYYLLFDEDDKTTFKKLINSEIGLSVVQNPVLNTIEDLNNKFYQVSEDNRIIILPSYGNLEKYSNDSKLTLEQTANLVLPIWKDVIKILKEKFSGFEICFKLHPAQSSDGIWIRIQRDLSEFMPDLIILDPKESAQEWILKSKVVVGEVTTALWWASFLLQR